MSSVEFYGHGVTAENVKPGDFLLTHGDYKIANLIRFGQALRYEKQYAYYHHAALVHTEDGWLSEALGHGVATTHLERYRYGEYALVRIDASEEDRAQVARFATAVAAARWKYGYLTLAGVALSVATGSKFVFGKVGSAICSGFVSEALTRAGYIFEKPPAYMAPADLARHFDVVPQHLIAKGGESE